MHSVLRPVLAVVIVGSCLGGMRAHGEGDSESVEIRELKAALELTRSQLAEEKARSASIESQRKALVESLAEAVRVSEEQMLSSKENELKLQAFGVDLFTKDDNSIEQRLLKAVRDLDIAQQEIERKSSALLGLSEAFMKFLGAATEAPGEARRDAESAIAAINIDLSDGSRDSIVVTDINKARVVSVDRSVGLVVFDAGRSSGIRVGTPVTVLRGETPVYTAMIVDVREAISGAVLQERVAETGDVEVGDGVRLLPTQRTL